MAVRQLAIIRVPADEPAAGENGRGANAPVRSDPFAEAAPPAADTAIEIAASPPDLASDRAAGAFSRLIGTASCFAAGLAVRLRRAFARPPLGAGAGAAADRARDEEGEAATLPAAGADEVFVEESAAGSDMADEVADKMAKAVWAEAPAGEPSCAPAAVARPAGVNLDEHARGAFSGAWVAGAVGLGAVVLSFIAGTGDSDFPGASFERALLSHPPVAPAGPPEWMFVDPSLPKHVLAARMVEEPGFDPPTPTDPGDGEPRPATVPLEPELLADRPEPQREASPGPAFKPVSPQPAARQGKIGHADNAVEPAATVPAQGDSGRDRPGSGDKALLATLPPPPPVPKVGRTGADSRQRGADAARADNSPTVLDKSAVPGRAAAPTDNAGGVEVQLIAVSRHDQAVSAWTGLVRENNDLLAGLDPAIVGGEGRGSLFRLRAGPFKSAEQAQSLCGSLKQRNVDCVVVRRGG